MQPNSPTARALPRHIGIIMDGNGRWAKLRGLPRIDGHKQGASSVRAVTRAARELGVKALTLFAFSAQNWERPVEEVRALMTLLRDYLVDERDEILNNNIKLITIGDEAKLPALVREPLNALRADSANNDGMTLCLALSYGGRESITQAAQKLAKRVADGEIRLQDINVLSFTETLPTAQLPELDLVIRTSGEQRISNFLLWEAAYAELYFTDLMWPEFGRDDLVDAIDQYQHRERRFGLTSEQLRLRAAAAQK